MTTFGNNDNDVTFCRNRTKYFFHFVVKLTLISVGEGLGLKPRAKTPSIHGLKKMC